VKRNQPIYDRSKAVRRMARNVVGSPQPTQVRGRRKVSSGGAVRVALDPTLNSPSKGFIHLAEYEKPVVGAPHLVTSEKAHAYTPAQVKKPQQWRPVETCFKYSQEVIDHLNFLRRSKGEEAAREYLNTIKSLKEHTPMSLSHTQMAETLRNQNEPRPVQQVDGSIESVLNDAQQKVTFYENESKRCMAEAERWKMVADNLTLAMQLTSQPLQAVSNSRKGNGHSNGHEGESTMRPKGYWMGVIVPLLNEKRVPMKKSDLFVALKQRLTKEDVTKMYPAISNMLKKGDLLLVGEDEIALPSWTEPREAH
jgi:hypothetical protein